jgi:hypothetical protein
VRGRGCVGDSFEESSTGVSVCVAAVASEIRSKNLRHGLVGEWVLVRLGACAGSDPLGGLVEGSGGWPGCGAGLGRRPRAQAAGAPHAAAGWSNNCGSGPGSSVIVGDRTGRRFATRDGGFAVALRAPAGRAHRTTRRHRTSIPAPTGTAGRSDRGRRAATGAARPRTRFVRPRVELPALLASAGPRRRGARSPRSASRTSRSPCRAGSCSGSGKPAS